VAEILAYAYEVSGNGFIRPTFAHAE